MEKGFTGSPPVHPPAGYGFANLFQVGPELPLNTPRDFVQTTRLKGWSGLNPLSVEPPVALTWAGKVQEEQGDISTQGGLDS